MLRTEKLLLALTPSERKAFDAKVGGSRSDALQRLYHTVLEFQTSGRNLIQEKQEVFLRVFGEPYSAEKDYLLRNVYREMSERLKDFLAEQDSLHSLADNPHEYELALLRALYRRKLWTEFDAHYHKAVKSAVAACEFYVAHQLTDLYADSLIGRHEISVEIMPTVKAVLHQSQEYLKQAYLIHAAYLQSKHIAICEHQMQLANLAFQPTSPYPDCNFEHLTNPIAEYHIARSLAFQEGGRGDIACAERALKAIMRVKAKSQYRFFTQATAMNNLAVAYMLNGRHKEACRYVERGIAYLRQRALPVDARFVINYLEALIKQRLFKKALSVIADYQVTLEQNEQTRFRAICLACYLHLFLHDYRAAFKLIPKDIAQHDEEQYHLMRYARIIIAYLRHQVDDALREALNFAKRFHKKRSRAKLVRDKRLVRLYIKWLNLRLSTPTAKTQALLTDLHHELLSLSQQQGFYVDYLPLLWLQAEVMRYVNVKGKVA